MFDGLIKYDETFFASLSRALEEETVQPRDLQMLGMLLPLGIEKGKAFKPDLATVAQMKAAAEEAHAWLMEKAATDVTPWWPDSQWVVRTPPITMKTEFKWDMPDYFGVDVRAVALSQYFCRRPSLAQAASISGPSTTIGGAPLEGGTNYRLSIPADVPVREFWSVTVYSLKMSSFFLNRRASP